MKKSTVNICFFLIASLLVGILAVVLSIFGLLPAPQIGALLAVIITTALLLVLFGVASFSLCHCAKKLHTALCRYGSWFVGALVTALLSALLLICMVLPEIFSIFYLVVLFVAAASFVFSILLLAGILYLLSTLGCPHCPPAPPKPPCREEDTF